MQRDSVITLPVGLSAAGITIALMIVNGLRWINENLSWKKDENRGKPTKMVVKAYTSFEQSIISLFLVG